ncbi:hypothetical protein ACHAWO_008071 [Cyclotella atomus]|uniref:MORN repeat-containing protein n=1 Tax=Cyclotella atomus TaxID=382360 RepID=A0ABD3MRV1_9STRA
MDFQDKRARTLSTDSTSTVSYVSLCLAGIPGKYSGGINESGRPHGSGSFVRDEGGMRYVGSWKDGERFGSGEYYDGNGRFLGNVVWD